jgi:outer membrane scaffolding protein for murein synthesis (MipA/OmpV family)
MPIPHEWEFAVEAEKRRASPHGLSLRMKSDHRALLERILKFGSTVQWPRIKLGSAAAAILLLASGPCTYPRPAWAQGLDEQELEQGDLAPSPAKKTWDITLGIGVAGVPTYPGAENYRASPIPLVSVKYRDLFFLSPGGLGMNAVNWRGFRAGPVIGYRGGRDQSDDAHLNGLGDIQPSATAGGFVAYGIGPFEIAATVRQAVIHTENGLTGRLDLHYRQPLIPGKLTLVFGPEVDFANGQYSRTWFGVSPSQSASSGLSAFAPNGGVTDVGLSANLDYRYTEHILLRSFVDIRQFVGDVADSPIVQSKTQAVIGAGIAYHF